MGTVSKKNFGSRKDEGKRKLLELLTKSKSYIDAQSAAKKLGMPITTTYRLFDDIAPLLDTQRIPGADDKPSMGYMLKCDYKREIKRNGRILNLVYKENQNGKYK